MPTSPLEDGALWYDVKGEGPPLVFVHGGWQNSKSWQQQVDYFADSFRVVTFDIRGHGKTGATDLRDYTVDLFVEDLEQLLTRLDIENPILVGNSIGGMIIQSYLAKHPTSARGAVISGPTHTMLPVDIPTEMNPLLSPGQAIGQMATTVGSKATFRSLVNTMEATNGGTWLSTDSDIRSQAFSFAGEVPSGEYKKIFGAVYEYDFVDLSHVETPILVLYGEQEAARIKRQGEQIATAVSHGRCQEIPDAAHLVNQDNPDAFNAACTTFFESFGVNSLKTEAPN